MFFSTFVVHGTPNDGHPVALAQNPLPPIASSNESAPPAHVRSSLPPINPSGGMQLTSGFGNTNPLPAIPNDAEEYLPPPTPEYMSPVSPPPPYSPSENV